MDERAEIERLKLELDEAYRALDALEAIVRRQAEELCQLKAELDECRAAGQSSISPCNAGIAR